MKNMNENLGGGDLDSDRVEVIKWSSFVNSERNPRFLMEFRQTEVMQKEFNV
jgi:hypothetical protein